MFLDEIDALLDAVLVSVLRQLRSGYPERPRNFPQTVATPAGWAVANPIYREVILRALTALLEESVSVFRI